MLVHHVVQIVAPGHNTSYKPGVHWLEAWDSQAVAETRAEQHNERISDQCIGVRYAVTGPHDETIPFEDLKLEL